MISLCNDWEFVRDPGESFLRGQPTPQAVESVRLPHNVCELPLHCSDPEEYCGVFGYRRTVDIEDETKRYFIRFDGAAHVMTLYVNGVNAGSHFCGYTAYRVEITSLLRRGRNSIAVKLDTNERTDVPPFGNVMDYLGYGGLYREAWLEIKGSSVIEDVFAAAYHDGHLKVNVDAGGDFSSLRYELCDGERILHEHSGNEAEYEALIENIVPWSPECPKLYTLRVELYGADCALADEKEIRIGFRTAEFKADGLYLNGEKYFMRGLDRHQCWPYIGYAAPASLQYEDARILKRELCCNAVRTSHYPQSQYFIDACDELGLLVFTEIPGWQHIGGEEWKLRTIENVREMVLQYRNHPSVILWGVRINESRDDDDLYRRTNELCRSLDPTRATSGVRFIKKSSLLEDVYAYNDFSYGGKGRGVLRKKDVTPDMGKALLVSEHNGHMFPTKSFDNCERRQEHALRHAKVLEAAYSSGEHAGCFGWCMFDYATHKQFGSGDRICYHGVMDSFRNPKQAAAVYASQGEETPVLEIGSSMEIGDHPASILGDIYAFTNADEVELYKNGEYLTSFRPEKSGLPHPPIRIDDLVGESLSKHENMSGTKERLIRESLNAAGRYGMDGLPLKYKLYMARCLLFHGMTYEEGYRLYGKYIGNWGSDAPSWRFAAKKDGREVASVIKQPSAKLHFEVKASRIGLREGDTYDMSLIRIRIADEFGQTASYAQIPVTLELTGEAELVGPSVVTAEGGMCGTFIKTIGKAGIARLKLTAPHIEPEILYFDIK